MGLKPHLIPFKRAIASSAFINAADTVYQNSGRNDGNGGVLRAADLHLAEQGLTAVNDIFCQARDLVSR